MPKMPAYKDETRGTWYTQFYYMDDKVKKHKVKRGFRTKGEAEEFEISFKARNMETKDMKFSDYYLFYKSDIMPRIRLNTWKTKEYIIEKKILPYFADMRLSEIKPKDVVRWQNWMLDQRTSDGYKLNPTYLRTINNQLSAMLNHAVKYYGLDKSPALSIDKIGTKKGGTMKFWTKEQYLQFSKAIMDKPLFFYGFEILYWCGLRVGELLALTPADFDFDFNEVKITKSYQRIEGRDIITPPKTEKGIRTITMPDFLVDEIKECIDDMGFDKDERMFPVTKGAFNKEMIRGCNLSGVERIRVHDLRHSHVSLLINMGFTALAIADRVGHESVDITYRYAHLFSNAQKEMATALNDSVNER
jgi:integrase